MADDWLVQAANRMPDVSDVPTTDSWMEKAAAKVGNVHTRQLDTSVGEAVKHQPDAIAKARKAAGIVGVPQDIAERQAPEVERLATQSEILRKLESTEVAKEAFADPDFAKVAHDSVDELSAIEIGIKGLRDAGANVQAAPFSLASGFYGGFETGARFLSEHLTQPVGEAARQVFGYGTVVDPAGLIEDYFKGLRQETALTADTLTEVNKDYGLVGQAVLGGVQSGVQSLGMIGGAMMTGRPELALDAFLFQAFGHGATEAADKGVPLDTAIVHGLSQGIIEKYTEKIALGPLLDMVKNRTGFGKQLVDFAAREMGGEQVATAFQDLNDWAILPENVDKSFGDYLAARPDAALSTAISTAVGGALQIGVAKGTGYLFDRISDGAKRDVSDQQAAQKARGVAQVLTEVVAAAEAAKLSTRDPEALQAFAEKVTAETGVEDLYFDAREFDNHFRQNGIDPATVVADIPGLSAQYDEAIASGGDLRIPLATYIAKVANTGQHEALVQHARMDPDDMTPAQAEQWEQTFAQDMQDRADKIVEQSSKRADLEASADVVRDTVRDQIVASGRFDQATATQYAELHRAFSVVMGEELGVSPEEVYQRFGLQVQGLPAAGGQQVLEAETLAQAAPDDFSTLEGVEAKIRDLGSVDAAMGFFQDPAVQIDAEISQAFFDKYSEGGKLSPQKTMQRAVDVLTPPKGVIDRITEFAQSAFRGAPAEEGSEPSAQRTLLFQSAYHGTPHTFDKFSLDAIGTGEGAQAYGWGLYFAAKKEIAEFYRDQLTPPAEIVDWRFGATRLVKDGVYVDYSPKDSSDMAQARALLSEDILIEENAVRTEFEDRGVEGAREEMLHIADARIATAEEEQPSIVTPLRVLRKAIEERLVFDAKIEEGRVVQVDIPDADVLLDWDTPLNEQPETVQSPIRDLLDRVERATPEDKALLDELLKDDPLGVLGAGEADFYGQERGSQLYRRISDLLGSDKAASEALNAAGIKGLRYLDGTSRGTAGDTHNYVIWDENAVTIEAVNDEMVQAQYAQSKRGTISMMEDITEAPSVISLLENADLSTFLHETGHFFFEVYRSAASQPDASAKITADMNALLDFVGVESLDAWSAMSVDERRAGHEKVAEAFEVYLFEGKAPSNELRSLFRTFRAWLVQAYREVKGYLTLDKITPEIRGVFDRMLATTEQIEQMTEQAAFEPLFKTAEEAGMSPADFAAYQDLDRARDIGAIEELERRSLRDMKWLANAKGKELKRLQAEAKAVRAQVRKEVADEVAAQPIYAARRFLTHGEVPDMPSLNQEQRRTFTAVGMDTTKLDTAALKEMYGDGPAARWRYMPTGRYGWHTVDGLNPDLVAELFGFASGDELVTKLMEAEKPNEAIENLTDARMLEEHGDITDPDQLEAAANEALHNEAHRRMVATELKRLAAETGSPRVLNRAAKDYAEQKIAAQKVRDLRPKQYTAAERRAAIASVKALAAGDREAAAQGKRDQILSGHLGRAATEAERDIQKALDYFKKFDKKDYIKRIDPAEQDAIFEILARYDLRKSVTLKDLDLRAHVAALAEAGDITEFTEIPEHILADSQRRSYKELTIEEMRGLHDTIKMLSTVGRNKKKLLAAEESVSFEEAKAEMLKIADEAIPAGKANPIDKKTMSVLERMGEGLTALNAPLVKVEQLLQFLDGNLPDGPWHRYLFRTVADAENARNRIDAEALYKVVQMLEAFPTERLQQKIYIASLGESLTVEAIMTTALNTGNESNLSKLKEGWGWSDEQLDDILRHLTTEELQSVQAIWDAVGELWPQIVEVERAVTGLTPKQIDPRPITINGVELQGGYFPVVYDPRFSVAGTKQEAAKLGAVDGQSGFFRPKIADGFTKGRITAAAGRIQLTGGLSTIPQHLSEVSHLVANKRALRDVWKILSDPDLSAAVKEKIGVPSYNQLTSWAHAVANGRAMTDDAGAGAWGRWINQLRRNVSLVAMGFKYTTFMSQFAGLAGSMEIYQQRDIDGNKMGLRYLQKASAQFLRHPVESTRFVFSMSDQIKNRIQSFDRDVRENFERMIGKRGHLDYIRMLAMKGTGYADLAVAVPTWMGAQQWAIDNGLSPAAAVAHADKTVRLSQGSGGIKDLNAAQRAASMQFLTLFFSYFAAYHGRLTSIIRDAKNENDVLKAHRMIDAGFRTFALVVLASTVSEILAGRIPQCEAGDDACWAKWAAGKSAAYLFAGIPLARDVSGALETGYSYTGTPLTSAGREMVVLLNQAEKMAGGEGDWLKLSKAAMKTTGYLAGVPGIAQLNVTGGYAWDLYTGEDEMEGPGDMLYFFARKPKE